jgi:hypothetical protein
MSLIGKLNEVKLADVLRLFAASGKTGLLTVSAPGRETLVRLEKGTIVHAVSGRLQGDDAVLDLFGWGDGQLTFVPEPKTVDPNITRSVDALIEDGVHQGALVHRMNELVSSDRLVFQMAAHPPEGAIVTLGTTEWTVVRLLDGIRDVREVLESSGLARGEVVRTLFALTEAGFLEPVELVRTLRTQALGRFGKDAAEIDAGIEPEWKKSARFAEGVLRVEVRAGRRSALVGVAFRSGLGRAIHLPRATLAELGIREGEEVSVRPAG